MKRSVIVLLSAIVSTGVASLASAQAKIGVVDVQRLVRESPQGKAATDTLNVEYGAKHKVIEDRATALQARQEKFKKDEATMSEVQKNQIDKELQSGYRDLQLRQSQFDDEYNAARQEAQEKLLRLLDDEVKTYAKAQGFDLILTDAAYVNATLDVTEAILKALVSRKPAAAPAAPASAAPANKVPQSIAKP